MDFVFRAFSYRKVIKRIICKEKCNLDLTEEQVEKLQIIT